MKIVLQVAACALPVCAVAQTSTPHPSQEIGKYEIHQVKKGETLYSLSRRYQTTVPALLDLNPSIVNNNLKTGSSINVPKQEQATASYAATDNRAYNGIGPKPYLAPVYYEVASGETLYSISQKTNNDVEVVKLWNDLKTNDIKPKQKLIVGYAENAQSIAGSKVYVNGVATNAVAETTSNTNVKKTNASTTNVNKDKTVATASHPNVTKTDAVVTTRAVETPKEKTATVTNASTTNSAAPANATASAVPMATNADLKTGARPVSVYDSNPSTAKLVYLTEKGICTWTRGSSESGSFYALHPTAPIGSTINVKNMMNNRSVQVKVIGRLPNTPENENIAVKISGSAAKELNALDSKFLAQLSYMGYETHKPLP